MCSSTCQLILFNGSFSGSSIIPFSSSDSGLPMVILVIIIPSVFRVDSDTCGHYFVYYLSKQKSPDSIHIDFINQPQSGRFRARLVGAIYALCINIGHLCDTRLTMKKHSQPTLVS